VIRYTIADAFADSFGASASAPSQPSAAAQPA